MREKELPWCIWENFLNVMRSKPIFQIRIAQIIAQCIHQLRNQKKNTEKTEKKLKNWKNSSITQNIEQKDAVNGRKNTRIVRGSKLSIMSERHFENSTPKERCTPEHSMQKTQPRLIAVQSGAST
jgi:hypothetical protein